MAFDDLKENLQNELKNSWERLQESSAYIQLREKYENLTPTMQKLTLIGSGVFMVLILFSLPMSYYSTSSGFVTEFEDRRQLIRDLLKSTREAQDVPNLPIPPDVNTLKSQIDSQLQAARLMPEQILGTEISSAESEETRILPQNMNQGLVKVSLAQLNLRQVVDIGHQIQTISSSVKMIDLHVEANAKDARYFDVIYKLAVLAIPSQIEATPEPEPPAKQRGN